EDERAIERILRGGPHERIDRRQLPRKVHVLVRTPVEPIGRDSVADREVPPTLAGTLRVSRITLPRRAGFRSSPTGPGERSDQTGKSFARRLEGARTRDQNLAILEA